MFNTDSKEKARPDSVVQNQLALIRHQNGAQATTPVHIKTSHRKKAECVGTLGGKGMDLIFFSITIYSCKKKGAGEKDTAGFVHVPHFSPETAGECDLNAKASLAEVGGSPAAGGSGWQAGEDPSLDSSPPTWGMFSPVHLTSIAGEG